MARRTIAEARAHGMRTAKTSSELDDFIAAYAVLAEDWEEAERLWSELLRTNAEVEGRPFSADVITIYGTLGVIAAVTGETDKARGIAAKLEQMQKPWTFGAEKYERARIAAQLGEKDAAVKLLRMAIGEGFGVWFQNPRLRRFALEPAFDSLRGTPGFEELATPKG